MSLGKASYIPSGSQRSNETRVVVSEKCSGVMPTTWNVRELMRKVFPTSAGSDPVRRQSAALTTATGIPLPGLSSSGRKPRPAAIWAPGVAK